jgi:DNA-binding NarL/FixJ family response regulator
MSTQPTAQIRVAIVEDEAILRAGLAKRIGGDPRYTCTDVFASGEELLACEHLDTIDVFLVDIGLPGMSGIDAIDRLRAMNLPGQILMLTNFDDDDHIRAAVLAGARGYLLKTTPQERLNNAIEEIHTGGAPINSIVARIIMDYMNTMPRPTALDTLTDRERDVLALLADRKQYKEIADILFMSIDTVRTHVRGVYTKLNVHKRAAAEKIYRETTQRT